MQAIQNMQAFLQRATQSLQEMVNRQAALPVVDLAELPVDKTLIVCIDMNQGFAKAGVLYSHRVERIIPATAAFLNRSADLGYRLILYSDCHTKVSPELTNYPIHCMLGTDEPELVKELGRFSSLVQPKNSTNGFIAKVPELDKVENVVVTGCCTDICIYQYAVTFKAYLNEKNLHGRVIVPMDLVETFDAPDHNADLLGVVALDSMMANGVTVIKSIRYTGE